MPPRPKYAPLTRYLRDQRGERLVLTFAEIEALIAAPLPAAASRSTWWSRPLYWGQGRSWRGAGWRVASVDIPERRVTFVRGAVAG